jgi:multicomponent Na+:H+ antiporter subunit B
MTPSLILRTAARYFVPLLMLFSIFILFRGHNLPGGGFAGGLLAATAFALHVFAHDAHTAYKALRAEPHALIGGGLLLAMGSGLPQLLMGYDFMKGIWAKTETLARLGISLGSPIIFDLGVYLVVVGVAVTIIHTLAEEEED